MRTIEVPCPFQIIIAFADKELYQGSSSLLCNPAMEQGKEGGGVSEIMSNQSLHHRCTNQPSQQRFCIATLFIILLSLCFPSPLTCCLPSGLVPGKAKQREKK